MFSVNICNFQSQSKQLQCTFVINPISDSISKHWMFSAINVCRSKYFIEFSQIRNILFKYSVHLFNTVGSLHIAYIRTTSSYINMFLILLNKWKSKLAFYLVFWLAIARLSMKLHLLIHWLNNIWKIDFV